MASTKFKFAYESLKKLRSNRLLLAKKELIAAEARLQNLLNEKQKTIEQRGSLIEDQSQKLDSPEICRLYSEMVESQTIKIRSLENDILTAEQEFERHRNWVTHLGRELRIVERLEEKKRTEFLDEQRRLEKRTLDGWTAEHWKADKGEGRT